MIQSNTARSTFVLSELSEIQRSSFCWFLKEALLEEFKSCSPIIDYTGVRELHFFSDKFKLKAPKYSVAEARHCDVTYSIQLYMPIKLVDNTKAYIIEQEVFLGEIPLMTDRGTFIINGAERVIVTQLHRSPGVFFGQSKHPNGTKIYSARVIPFKGAWMEFATDINNVMYAYIDRKKKFPVTTLLRALGMTMIKTY